MSIFHTLVQVRSMYGATPTTNECGEICNETAWIHRNDSEQWGVSTKNSGNHAVLPDGSNIAADIIQNGVTLEAYDCLQDAGDGGTANPQWIPIGVLNDPARPWKAPIDPGDEPPPDPPDDEDDILQAIDELSLEIIGLRQLVIAEFHQVNNKLDAIINALRQDSPANLSYGIKGTVKGKVIP